MPKASGKCFNCNCIIELSRDLGCTSLGELCPVCGCKKIIWEENELAQKNKEVII